MSDFLYLLVNVGEDCPAFDGLFEFSQISAGGSLGRVAFLRMLMRRSYLPPLLSSWRS